MCKELVNMINSNSLSPDEFFTVDPFSYFNDKQYGKIADSINFFDDLYVVANKTYERLATLAKLSIDDSLSALVVTGYSGSGKTNFLRFCEAIIQNKLKLPDYNNVQSEIEHLYSIIDTSDGSNNGTPTFFDEEKKEKAVSERKKISENFNQSINKIKGILYQEYFSNSSNEIGNSIADFLNSKLHGLTVYLDFDKDKQEYRVPLKLKLIRQIESHLYTKNPYIEKVNDFYHLNQRAFTRAFENCSAYLFDEAINFIFSHRDDDFENYKADFLKTFSGLDIDQLLCVEILLKMAENLSNEPCNIYYFIDNIDMISGPNNKVLVETISKFWDFIKELQSFMHEIRGEEKLLSKNEIWIKTYEKFKYIFSMRETTAMHICDHLRSRISTYAKHIDISLDINKSFIFKKRYNLLKQYIDQGRITNNAFIEISQCIESITEDKYYKWTLFELFNNDYRKAISCLCSMSRRNTSSIYACLPMIQNTNPYTKFGGRGVIVKSICDSFKQWNYFSNLKIPMLKENTKNSPYNITLMRIILTVLDNLQNELSIPEDSFFFIKREDCISLKKLYENVQMFCNKDVFLQCIEKMFSGRNWSYWNHLITFDNIIEYSENDLKKSLSDDCKDEIYIRCTKAGERYLENFCIHYEFFACRYTSNPNKGLFSQTYTKRKNAYPFQKQIEQVIENVANCCVELKKVNLELMKHLGYNDQEDLLDTQYVKNNSFHEERIIHNHITYLDAFRQFLITGPLKDDVINVNTCLIKYIKNYLELLKTSEDQFYSQNSEALYDELYTCIGEIEKKQYLDTDTIISRTYYMEAFHSNMQ